MVRRAATAAYVLVMALLAVWLLLFDGPGPTVCAAVIVALTTALAATAPGRRWLYAVSVVLAVATMVVGLWPTDSGGYCGSVLLPGQGVEAYDSGGSAHRYFDACDDRAAVHGVLVMLGGAGSGLLLGASLRWPRRAVPSRASHVGDAASRHAVRTPPVPPARRASSLRGPAPGA